MKNKKIKLILILVICIFVVTGCGKKTTTPDSTSDDIKLANHEVANLKKTDTKLPKFDIKIGGIANIDLVERDLKLNNIFPYEFDAKIETPWGYQTNKFIGYKIDELLSILKTKDYKSITVSNSVGTRVTYSLNTINNGKLFLVFYMDGKPINNGKMAVISVDENEKYFVSNVVKITVNNVEVK